MLSSGWNIHYFTVPAPVNHATRAATQQAGHAFRLPPLGIDSDPEEVGYKVDGSTAQPLESSSGRLGYALEDVGQPPHNPRRFLRRT